MKVIKNKVYIRVDGSAKIGLGHLVRCLALAQMLKEAFVVTFISKEIPEILKAELIKYNVYLKLISLEEEFFKLLSGDEIVVIDHYSIDSNYQKRIKNIGSKLVCIDDLHDKEFFADLIINHSPGIVSTDYKAQDYTKFALGPEYALLRPAFLNAAVMERKIGVVKKVLICFGGSDIRNLTKSVLKVVQRNEIFHTITVILGSAFPYKNSLDEIVKNNRRIRVLSSLNENDMLEEIRNTDLAIIPTSGILFEVIAGGALPVICYYAENQKELFNYFKSSNFFPSFSGLGFNEDELTSVLTNIVEGKVSIKGISFRDQIKKSQTNNLNNFKNLVNGQC